MGGLARKRRMADGSNPSRRARTRGLEERLRNLLLAKQVLLDVDLAAGVREGSHEVVSTEWLARRLRCRVHEARALLPEMARQGLVVGRALNALPGHDKLYAVRPTDGSRTIAMGIGLPGRRR